MAVKASASITLSFMVDIQAVYRYYKLQSSTASKPGVPTTNPPSGWTDSEPSYTSGSTNTLYFVDLTVFTNGTFLYSPVSKSSSYEAAKEAYNKAVAAGNIATNAQSTANNTQANLNSYKTNNLIRNGFGEEKSNINFTHWVFDGVETYNNAPSFKYAGTASTRYISMDQIPVDVSKTYEFSMNLKAVGTEKIYLGWEEYDIDSKPMSAHQQYAIEASTTTLAKELKNGDTVVYLTSTSGWVSTAATHQLGLIFWNYKDSTGYQYPEGVYSRNSWLDLYTNDNVNKTTHTITLKSAWSNGTFPAGTKVSQTDSAGFKYRNYYSKAVPTEWENTTFTIGAQGIQKAYKWAEDSFNRATKFVRFVILHNYGNYSTSSTTHINSIRFSDITIELAVDTLIKSVDVEYYLSTSQTSLSGGSWVSTAPTWVNGKYMWSRTKTVLQNGSILYKPSETGTCIAGATGATGATGSTGTGIDSISEEYYLSTSKTSQTGGSWSTTPPTWSTGKYVWTRSKIVYKNPASTVYTTPVCDSSWEAVNEIQIGGRNLVSVTNVTTASCTMDIVTTESFHVTDVNSWAGSAILINKTYPAGTYTINIEHDLTRKRLLCNLQLDGFIANTTYNGYGVGYYKDFTTFPVTITIPAEAKFGFILQGTDTVTSTEVRNLKIEIGDKATDWTPAPEDVDGDINDVQNMVNETAERVNDAQLLISNLTNSIAALVRDGNGGSLIRQDSNGLWYFNIGEIEKNISDTANDLDSLSGIVVDANGQIDVLASTAAALQERTEYVRSYTDENGQPCLELGEGDSVFKVRITNTEIQFAEGTDVPTRINRKMLIIEKTMVRGELQFGDDEEVGVDAVWIWKRRSNGNLGLTRNEVIT